MAKISKPQNLPLGDSYLNLVVGIIVVVAVAAVIIGLIRGKGTPGVEQQAQQPTTTKEVQVNLPTKHTVAAGEDLWKISEKYYKTGYNWVDIAKENNLTNPNALVEGMELTIPSVAAAATESAMQTATPTPVATATPMPTTTPMPAITESPSMKGQKGEVMEPAADNAIGGNSYTVVKGDSLWKIAVRAYGDGYKWVEIARANKLVNPNIIHPGNALTLPR